MRRFACSLLVPVLLVVVALAGCSGAPTTTTTGPAVEPPTTTPTPPATTAGSNDTGSAMFRGNLERTGVYASGGPSQLNELVWKIKTGAAVYSSPAISDGVVYFGSSDGNLYAVR
jgi:hypothetical protein